MDRGELAMSQIQRVELNLFRFEVTDLACQPTAPPASAT
jgi:hypothetical protein